MIEMAHDEFAALIKNPSNSYFRKTALSATGLVDNDECNGADKKPSQKCAELLSIGVAEILAKQEFQQKYSGFSVDGSIADSTYLTESSLFKDVQSRMIAKLKKDAGQEKLNSKIKNTVFPQVKKIFLSKIESMVTDSKLRESLIDKVKSIQYSGSDCSKDYGSGEKIPGVLKSNAFYEFRTNTFQYCLGLGLQSDSEFQIAAIIAHELSHSIDPCG